MSPEQKSDSLLLSSKDKVDGLYILTDKDLNITLLRGGRSVAWFSAIMTEEGLKAFLKVMKDFERSDQGTDASVYKLNKYRGSYETRKKGFRVIPREIHQPI